MKPMEFTMKQRSWRFVCRLLAKAALVVGSSAIASPITTDGHWNEVRLARQGRVSTGCDASKCPSVSGNRHTIEIAANALSVHAGSNAFLNATPIPEPATLALFGLGLIALGSVERVR